MSDKISYVTLSIGLLLVAACSSKPIKIPDQPVAHPPSVLVLGLDGIPYSTFKKLQDGGHFRNFNNVSPMIASFPSISDPNWDHLFSLGPERGLTKAFFDPTIKTDEGIGHENGSILDHLTKEPEYERAVDFKVDGPFEHLSTFIWTETTGKYWLSALQTAFFNFSEPNRDTFFALIINSDLLSHVEGEMSLMNFLAQVEGAVDKIQAYYKKLYGKDLEVILVSDHGNAYFSPKDIAFEESLKNQGWNVKSTLSGPRDVGFFVPEILSFGAFYSLPESRRDLALALASTEHVQSTMYQNPAGEIHILSGGGQNETVFKYNDKKRTLAYEIIKGTDPLQQIQFFKASKNSLTADTYFAKSLDSIYPNALMRIWEGFNRNSVTKPQVLVNPELGWVFGNATLRLLTDVRGFASCHGSLHRDESLGIFVSTRRELPAVRPQDFRQYIAVDELKTKRF